MGDPSTHVIFYGAYWHLVYLDEDGMWTRMSDFFSVCKEGEEDRKIALWEDSHE